MSFKFSFKLPIRAHYKKMIARTTQVDPFLMSTGTCHYSNLLYSALTKKYFPVDIKKNKMFNDELEVIIPIRVAKERRFYIDYETVSFLDKTFKSMFDEKFLFYMADNCKERGDLNLHIQKFRDNYDLSEEIISNDALIKKFQRARKSKKIKFDANLKYKSKPTKDVTEFTPIISKQLKQIGLFDNQ